MCFSSSLVKAFQVPEFQAKSFFMRICEWVVLTETDSKLNITVKCSNGFIEVICKTFYAAYYVRDQTKNGGINHPYTSPKAVSPGDVYGLLPTFEVFN